MIASPLITGHADLADWLLLIAVIVFVLAAVLTYAGQTVAKIAWVPIGLAFVAAALLVV